MEHHTDVEARIDSDFAGRCWDGLWGNLLCIVLTVLTTSLLTNHHRTIVLVAILFAFAALARGAVLVWRKWFDSFGRYVWRRCAISVTLFNGALWGGLSAYLTFKDGYHNPDVMVLLLYLSAVAAAAGSLLVHDKRLIVIYMIVLYVPSCLVELFGMDTSHWGTVGAFGLYSAFLIIHGGRSNREYLSRLEDNHALACIAKHDFLTGLRSRFFLENELNAGISRAAISGGRIALLYIDLNGFKHINDTLSHQVGDQFLCAIAGKIQTSAGAGAVVARLGGDEFAVLIEGAPGREDVARIAGEILNAIQLPFQLAGHTLHGSASVGISFYPDDARDSGDLFRTADRAMYAAKRAGGSRYTFTGDVSLQHASSDAATSGSALAQWSERIHEPIFRKSTTTETVGTS